MKIFNQNYYNDNGERITKKEHEKEIKRFLETIDSKYEKEVEKIINRIKETARTDEEKLWLLFDFFTGNDMVYNDSAGYDPERTGAYLVFYPVDGYKNWKIGHQTKYPAILHKSGVCITYSKAFEDLANRLKIPCRSIGFEGYNGRVGHEWNYVLINNEFRHIDIAMFLQGRRASSNLDKRMYYLINDRAVPPDIDKNSLEREMKVQYDTEHKIKIFPKKSIFTKKNTILEKQPIVIYGQQDLTKKKPVITIYSDQLFVSDFNQTNINESQQMLIYDDSSISFIKKPRIRKEIIKDFFNNNELKNSNGIRILNQRDDESDREI